MKKILITGGAGFIGSHLAKRLLSIGDYEVHVIDNFDNFYSQKQKDANVAGVKSVGNFHFYDIDIRDAQALSTLPRVDAIFHLAAKAGVRPSIADPNAYFDVNVAGTQNLLEFAKEKSIKKFVFASSSSVYGVNENVPWKESENLQPISPYAASKLSGEMLGHVYHKLYDIQFLALRLFTVYGPSQRPDLAIHSFFRKIKNGEAINVYGDGTTERDYTFVGDIIDGFVSALKYDSTGFEIINLGNNHSVKLNELVAAIEEVIGVTAKKNHLPEQPGDVRITYADISKAKKLLKYVPKTNLREGLREFYNWYGSYYSEMTAASEKIRDGLSA